MATYTLQRNIKTQRAEATDLLTRLFAHLDALGVDLDTLTIAKTGPQTGTVTVVTVQDIRADQVAHLGLG